MSTRIITTHKNKAGKRKKFAKSMTRKVHKTHKGYPMRGIVKAQMTYKRGKKR